MISIPAHFMTVHYNAAHFPGAPGFSGFEQGANCQVFAYAFLAHHGVTLPPFRSSNLWEDTAHTRQVGEFEPLDLLLFGPTLDPYGAHVGVYIGDGMVLHLCAAHGLPLVESIPQVQQRPRHRCLLGGKRVLPHQS